MEKKIYIFFFQKVLLPFLFDLENFWVFLLNGIEWPTHTSRILTIPSARKANILWGQGVKSRNLENKVTKLVGGSCKTFYCVLVYSNLEWKLQGSLDLETNSN